MSAHKQELKRGPIVARVCAGCTDKEISDFSNISVSTVKHQG